MPARYALFTLVGIAGEDDLDAPDLNAPTAAASAAEKPAPNNSGRLNGGQRPTHTFRAAAAQRLSRSRQSQSLAQRPRAHCATSFLRN